MRRRQHAEGGAALLEEEVPGLIPSQDPEAGEVEHHDQHAEPGGEQQEDHRGPARSTAGERLTEEPPRLLDKKQAQAEPGDVEDQRQAQRYRIAWYQLAEQGVDREDRDRRA